MGFFSDLKEDLSQAVNELMPEEELGTSIPEMEESLEDVTENKQEEETISEDNLSLEEMLKNIDSIQLPEAGEEEMFTEDVLPMEDVLPVGEGMAAEAITEEAVEAIQETEEPIEEEAADSTEDLDLESMLESALATETHVEEKAEECKGEEVKMDYTSKTVSDETAVITAGMVITGDMISEGSVDVVGCINGNIDILGKLNITGHITGNSKASEIYAEGAKINGEVVSEGAVKIGASSVVIGNITANSAAIAGAVKGDIDVKGPVILDASAIVMGNIKSKSVQINNGAVIEGMCSQCYADVSPTAFFDDYKPEIKKGKSK